MFPLQDEFDEHQSPLVSNEKSKRKVKVKFSDETTVTIVTPCSEMNETDKKDIWFDCDELASFRKNAKADARLYQLAERAQPHKILSSGVSTQALPNANDASIGYHELTRGLEHRMNTERQKCRYITRFATLEAQRRLKRKAARKNKSYSIYADSLADVASKFSRWAREIARHAGLSDEQAAYPKRTKSIDFIKPTNEHKRTNESVSSTKIPCTSPNKRQRISNANIPVATAAIVDISNGQSNKNVNTRSINSESRLVLCS